MRGPRLAGWQALERPAIVLGVETQIGLGLVRELGRSGVRVLAVSHDPKAIGLASRYVWRAEVCGQPRSPALVAQLKQWAQELGGASLLTVSEANLAWVNSVRASLGEHLHPAVPGVEQLGQVLDKARTLALAQQLGLAIPRTWRFASLAEAEVVSEQLFYPLVLKWADPNAVAKPLSVHGLPLLKAEYVRGPEALMVALGRYRQVGELPMVQQYCAGSGLGQFFFMRDGMAVRCFQHRRVAEWPPEGGYSAVCDAVPLNEFKELQAQSIALLQAMRWEGVAMVEYRHDEVTGKSVLMEVNGRFWGSLPLAVASGAGFALHAHAAALGLPAPDLGPPRTDLRCRMLVAEGRRLVRVAFQPGRIADPFFRPRPWRDALRFCLDFISPHRRYFVASLDDPKPLARDLLNMLRRGR